MRRAILNLILFLTVIPVFSTAPDEGIWIPLLIEKYNIRIMKDKGFRLSAEDIYSVNRACMKDAVVSFNGGWAGGPDLRGGVFFIKNHFRYGSTHGKSTVLNVLLSTRVLGCVREGETPQTRG